MARNLILDSEALSSLARPQERGAAKVRAQNLLEVAATMQAIVRVPAAVLVEVYRGRREDATIDRVLRRVARVVPTGFSIARLAGRLLAENRLDSAHAVDAIVVATAVRLGGGLIATHDPADIKRLAQRFSNVAVFAI